MAFKSQDDSLQVRIQPCTDSTFLVSANSNLFHLFFQNRLSLAHSKSILDSSGFSKSFRVPSHQSTSKKGKENISSVDVSTPLSTRPSAKVKEDMLSPAYHSPARNSPAGSPATPLKEVQNQQQVN